MSNKLYKILRSKGYTSRECEYALNRYKGRMFIKEVRELDFNTNSKSKLNFYIIDSEWNIKWLRDKAYIGTKAYQGMAYFWGYRYRHSLRECTNASRRLVHDLFLKEGLKLEGETKRHDEIMDHVFNNPIHRKILDKKYGGAGKSDYVHYDKDFNLIKEEV